MKKIINTKLFEHRNNCRLWIEGDNLKEAGFIMGRKYTLSYNEDQSKLLLKLDSKGTLKVSGRLIDRTPIIDLCNAKIQKVFGRKRLLQIIFSERKIVISPRD
jgi:hypothetical protein